MMILMVAIGTCFNPRSRAGSDRNNGIISDISDYVSIHAPARGATFYAPLIVIPYRCFNPRSRAGSDYYIPYG